MKLAVALPGVFVFSLDTKMKPIVDVSDIYKTTPDSSREVSEIDEFIDKAKQNIDTAIFTINMTEKPLTEVADFLEMLVPQVKVPESVRSNSVTLQVGKKSMKEIIRDLGLEIGSDKNK